MKGGKTPLKTKGYTIIEVMIVLAVSGVMFVIAANFIDGKQANTSFTQGVNELTTQLQSVINAVADGKYSDIAITCDGPPVTIIANTNVAQTSLQTQGTNNKCVFKGKLVHFYQNGLSSPRDLYEIIPLVDLRTSTGNNLANINSSSLLVQKETIPQHLEVVKATVTPAAGATLTSPENNIGFVQSTDTESGVGSRSGAQSVGLVFAAGPAVPTANNANPGSLTGSIARAKKFTLCITNGNRYAIIDIGGNDDNALTATAHMKGTTSCAS